MSVTLTDLAKVRAEYWADGPSSETPPGHRLLFGAAACRVRGYSRPITAVRTRFPDADLHGRSLWASVGQNAWARAQTYFNGPAGG